MPLELLEEAGFSSSKLAKIPMDPGTQLDNTSGELLPNPSIFRRLLGRLMYLTISRHGITFTIHRLSQFMASQKTTHLQALHHVLQYLETSPGQGILFPADSSSTITAYVDSDWGNCKISRKSTSGCYVYIVPP